MNIKILRAMGAAAVLTALFLVDSATTVPNSILSALNLPKNAFTAAWK